MSCSGHGNDVRDGVSSGRPRQHGTRIRELRTQSGQTQEALGFRAGVATKTVSRAETGGSVSEASLDRIARALGVRAGDLYDPFEVAGYFLGQASDVERTIERDESSNALRVPTGFVAFTANGWMLTGTVASVVLSWEESS